jgi:hypothetical protein
VIGGQEFRGITSGIRELDAFSKKRLHCSCQIMLHDSECFTVSDLEIKEVVINGILERLHRDFTPGEAEQD